VKRDARKSQRSRRAARLFAVAEKRFGQANTRASSTVFADSGFEISERTFLGRRLNMPETTLPSAKNLRIKIRAHGAETYPRVRAARYSADNAPREILAFIAGNRRDDSPRNRFSVTAEDVLDAEKACTGRHDRDRRLVRAG